MVNSKFRPFAVSAAIFCFLFFSENAYAMHIMEGYLTPLWCLIWAVISLPFVIIGFGAIRKVINENPKMILILAMCGAFAFVLSALKIPSVTGSSSHATGVGLGAILFGPFPMAAIGTIILLFQALLLAHGGITTLGANVFSMAVVGPITAYFVFRFIKKCGFSNGPAVFSATFLGDMLTYAVTSFQLASAYPAVDGGIMVSLAKFAGIFAVTQIPLAISEGLLSVIVYNVLVKYGTRELKSLSAM